MAKRTTKNNTTPASSNGSASQGRDHIDAMSISELQGVLQTRKKRRGKLEKRRDKLQGQLDDINRQIAEIDGIDGPSAGPGRRARNSEPLPDVLERVMKKSGKTMRVPELVDAVQAEGYQSKSANFRGIVNQTLIKEDRFKNVARGEYALK